MPAATLTKTPAAPTAMLPMFAEQWVAETEARVQEEARRKLSAALNARPSSFTAKDGEVIFLDFC